MRADFWKPDLNEPSHALVDELTKIYGQRSVTLARLMAIAHTLDFRIPPFLALPIAFSSQMNTAHIESKEAENASSYLALDEGRVRKYYEMLDEHLADITVASSSITASSPIIRGGSSLEGSNDLSFAGVCRTVIPQKGISLSAHIQNGVAKVLAGSFTPYADYYFAHHAIHRSGRDVGVTLMKLVESPIMHATAYVYPDEIRVKYFLSPTVGAKYAGGHELLIRRENFATAQLPEHARRYKEIWSQITSTLWSLHDYFHDVPVPIDVEFLVDESEGKQALHIVQMRQISKRHSDNYLQAKLATAAGANATTDVLIESSHLYHSVGEIMDADVIDLREPSAIHNGRTTDSNGQSPIFLISHNAGDGTFDFLNNLKDSERVAAILIAHPEERHHDHIQYAVYEDRRANMVVHCTETAISRIAHGDRISLISNGNNVSIKIKR